MNNEILNKFLLEMVKLLETAKDFAMAQAPEICREVIKYNTVMGGLWLSSAVVFGLVAYKWGRKVFKNEEHSDAFVPVTIISGFLSILIFAVNISDFIKVLFAPKLYLIEYFASLVQK